MVIDVQHRKPVDKSGLGVDEVDQGNTSRAKKIQFVRASNPHPHGQTQSQLGHAHGGGLSATDTASGGDGMGSSTSSGQHVLQQKITHKRKTIQDTM